MWYRKCWWSTEWRETVYLSGGLNDKAFAITKHNTEDLPLQSYFGAVFATKGYPFKNILEESDTQN